MENNFKMAANIDWLQLSVYLDSKDFELKKKALFTFEDVGFSTRHFQKITKIYWDEKEIFSLAWKPYKNSAIYNSTQGRLGVLKVLNEWLYTEDYRGILENFIKLYEIEFKAFARLDLSFDFHRFKNISCEGFIKKVLSGKYFKTSHCEVGLNGKMNGANGIDFENIRFGSRSSDCCLYLYNKTKEMQAVKDKPYIRDFWALNGLDKNKDVWRLEFSCKSSLGYLKIGNKKISLKNWSLLDNLKDLQDSLLSNKFDFRSVPKSRKTSKRMDRMKKVPLFGHVIKGQKLTRFKPSYKSNRTDKVLVKKIEELNSTLRGQERSVSSLFLLQYIQHANLQEWARDKIKDYGNVNFKQLLAQMYVHEVDSSNPKLILNNFLTDCNLACWKRHESQKYKESKKNRR